MKTKSPFERDFSAVEERFPKLKYGWNKKTKSWVIRGELDICDVEGVYWNTFDIILVVPHGYPYCIPVLIENSKIIPREEDWHISKEGICCYDIEHNLIVMSQKGIMLSSFIEEKIYSYLANQLYKLEGMKYAGDEYAHRLDGVIQYYKETHHLRDASHIVAFLDALQLFPKIGRNEPCPCGSNLKVKNCHGASISTIKSLGQTKVMSDLTLIKEFLLKKDMDDTLRYL